MDDGAGLGLVVLVVFLAVVGFPLVFVGFWLAICSVLASIARWPALAAKYPAPGPAEGTRLSGEVTAVGSIRDRRVTTLHLSPSGLRMESSFLFRVRRAPVLVPWPAVRYGSRQSLPWSKTHLLDLGGITSLRVTERGFEAIDPYLAPDEQLRARSAP
jgi:hypothetical protein